MKPTPDEVNHRLMYKSGISNVREVVGYIHVCTREGTLPFELLLVKANSGQIRGYHREGTQGDFRRCDPTIPLLLSIESLVLELTSQSYNISIE